MNRYRSLVVPGVTLLLAILIVALLIMAERGAPPAQGEPPAEPPFAVLAEGVAPSEGLLDELPAGWVDAYGLDLEEAQSAVSSSNHEVAVVPGEEAVCIVSETVSGCAGWLDAELGKLALIESCSPGLDPGEVRVTGLLPDPASTAAITRPPAGAVAVSASLNVYVETFSGAPEEIASAGLTVPAELPWDATDESMTTCVVPEDEQLALEDGE